MNVDEAALATRAFYIEWNGLKDAKVWQVFTPEHVAASRGFNSRDDAQAACDRMNLRAVLEAIRGFGGPFAPDYEMVIDAIIEEVGK